jgi:hypothetical protein
MYANPITRTFRLNGVTYTEYWAVWPTWIDRWDFGRQFIWLGKYYSYTNRGGRTQYIDREDFEIRTIKYF